ncbi:unnamed protein product, partial [Didymodactylos carnosus]
MTPPPAGNMESA